MIAKLTTGVILTLAALSAGATGGDCESESNTVASRVSAAPETANQAVRYRSNPGRPDWSGVQRDDLDDGYTNVEYLK